MTADRIFINYRRADARWAAARLYDDVRRSLGDDKVFMDVDGIPPGVDFVEHLESHVAQCRALLALIGPDWLEMRSESGMRRIDDPDDFVTIELAGALTRGIPVIPVLVDGAMMPGADQLPDAIKPLARRQAVRISHESYSEDVGRILRSLGGETEAEAAAERGRSGGGRRMAVIAGGAALLAGVGGVAAWLTLAPAPPPPVAEPSLATAPGPTIVGVWRHDKGRIEWVSDEKAFYDWGGAPGRLEGAFDGRSSTGIWIEERSDTRCAEARGGSRFWGAYAFTFNPSLSRYSGFWGYCDGPVDKPWSAVRLEDG